MTGRLKLFGFYLAIFAKQLKGDTNDCSTRSFSSGVVHFKRFCLYAVLVLGHVHVFLYKKLRPELKFLGVTLGAETFAGRNFCDFLVFWHFLPKFLPRHNLD